MRRRNFLRIGTLGTGGLTLAGVSRCTMAAPSSPRPLRERSVILYWLDGGPTHMETYDPKPEAPQEFRGPFGAIQTKVPGVVVNELLMGHAAVMDKAALIRSVHHNNGDHFAAAHWMLTGYHGSEASNRAPQFPSAGSIITKLGGPRKPMVPAYVAVPYAQTIGIRPGYHSATYLGQSFNPFDVNDDPNRRKFSVRNLSLPRGVNGRTIEDRRALLKSLDALRRDVDTSGVLESADAFEQQALDLILNSAVRQAFDLTKEDDRLRNRYGRHTYGQSALLARRLVEAGARFVTIHNGGWDHHNAIEKAMKSRLPSMDQSIATLIADLSDRGLLDSTMVVVMGEFGRTPRVNRNAGRDHWGYVMSVLMAGGGLKAGTVIGASDAQGQRPTRQPVAPADILATIYHQLGIDLNTTFPNHAGRPIFITEGKPIHGLV